MKIQEKKLGGGVGVGLGGVRMDKNKEVIFL